MRTDRRSVLIGGAALAVAAFAPSACDKSQGVADDVAADAAPPPPAATSAMTSTPAQAAGAPAAEAPGIPRRESYTFPSNLEEPARALQQAGIPIVFGPNTVPAPAGISAQAKAAWANQLQVPLPVDDPAQLAAVRQFGNAGDQTTFDAVSATRSVEDRQINGITVQRVDPQVLSHPDKAVVFIHGGAWVLNSRRTQLPLQCAIADALGVPVLSIEYRLAPEHPYPAALDDVIAAYTGIIEEFRPEDVQLLGVSAGGGLTLATLLRLKKDGLPLPGAAAALCPGADMTHSGYLFTAVGLNDPVLSPYDIDLSMRAYVAGATPTEPLVSPVFGDFAGCPPLFLLATTAEIIGSDGIRVAQSARTSGVDVTLVVSDGMWHVPVADGTGIPEVQQAYDQLIGFFRRRLPA
jgi:monoterpene epsilon-lactone hydrolase